MADTIDSSPLPELPPGTVVPMAFNAGFGISSHPEIQQDLSVAQSVLTGLTGKLRDHIVGEIAKSAAVTDDLLGKIQEPIRQDLGHAALTLQALHGPIMADIAGHLGNAMQQASTLGVVPPVPGQPDIMPAMVQIRQAAMHGDLTPAYDAYRLTALPLEGFGGMDYAKSMQSIVSALPDDPTLRQQFASGVAILKQQQAMQPGLVVKMPENLPGATPVRFEDAFVAPAFTDVTDCAAQRAKALQAALNQCTAQYYPDTAAIGACQAAVQQKFLQLPPCEGPGGGGGVPGVPSGPGGPGGPKVIPVYPGAGGSAGNYCPPGLVVSPDGLSCVPAGGGPGVNPPAVQPPVGGGVGGGPSIGGPVITVPGGGGSSPPTGPGGSPPTGPGSGCLAKDGTTWTLVQIATYLSQLLTSDYDATQACSKLTADTGIQCYPNFNMADCDKDYVPVVANIAGSSTPIGFCVKCKTGSTPPTKSGCCDPPIINVTCPTVPSVSVPPVISAGASPPPSQPSVTAPSVTSNPVAGCSEFGPTPAIRNTQGFKDLSKILGLTGWDGTPIQLTAGSDPTGLITSAGNAVLSLLRGLVDQAGTALDSVARGVSCFDDQMIGLAVVSLITGLAEKYLGDTLDPIAIPNRQQRNFLCPTLLPSVDGTAEAWFGNTIDEKTAECWVRAANGRWPEFKKMFEGRRTKLSSLQIGSLYLRGKLTDTQFSQRIRELGFIQSTDVPDIQELLKQIPPPTDLVRFMVRDTADAALVRRFGMDTDFDLKFANEVKEWAKQSGVMEDYMRSVWRAHWSIPAPGQLFEMLHRSAEMDPANSGYTTQDDVETALKQQDILPYWIPKLLSITYNKLGRIDLRRGYQLGVLDNAALTKKYQVAGYNQADAEQLTKITEKQTLATFKRSPIVGQFSKGLMADDEFTEALSSEGATPDMIQACRKRAGVLASISMRKRCTDAYHKRYLLGDLSRDDARANLVFLGTPGDMVENILKGWDCERDAGGKALPASELAAMYGQGAIDAPGLVQRLRRLGYAYDDAVLLARRIATTTQQRVTKAEQDAIRRQENDDYKMARRAATAVRSQIAAANAAQRRTASLQRVRQLREKRLLESGRNFSTHSGLSLSDATATVRGVYDATLSGGLFLPDEVIAALVTASRDKAITAAEDLSAAVRDILKDVSIA